MRGTSHVEPLHGIDDDDEALAIDSFDVYLVRIAGAVWRTSRDGVLLITLGDVGIRREADIEALILHQFGGCRASVCVWTVVVQEGKEQH